MEGFTKQRLKKFHLHPLKKAKICKFLKDLMSEMPIEQGLGEVEVKPEKAGC